MADDIQTAISANPIKTGYAVIGENTINYFQDRATMSGVVSEESLRKPVIADIEDKYDDRFDDPTYY